MLTEPDMQARYLAATLSVIETEMRATAVAADRSALFALVSRAATAATRLADALAQPGRSPDYKAASSTGKAAAVGGNVIAFRR
ncbi:hypothetical protein ACVWW4_006618 [Bradyrhizobium sp. LB7.1]